MGDVKDLGVGVDEPSDQPWAGDAVGLGARSTCTRPGSFTYDANASITGALVDRRRSVRLAAIEAVTAGADVVRAAALLVGADAANRSHPMERLTRDSQMLLHHVSVNTSAQERLGNVLLGSYAGPAGLI